MTSFETKSLEQFTLHLEIRRHPDEGSGKKVRTFAEAFPGAMLDSLPDGHIKRSEIFALAADESRNTATVSAAILAWGGMRLANRKTLLGSLNWLALADDIRRGGFDRKSSYKAFMTLQARNEMKGMGPAFFTKLIYFLLPRNDPSKHAYIMDQWAGCSINVLCGREVVLMDKSIRWKPDGVSRAVDFVVSPYNSADHYDEFCEAMDALAAKFSMSPEQIDRAVMGEGGKSPSAWRRLVIENRRAA